MIFAVILSLPSSRRQIASELGKTRAELKSKLAPTTYPDGITLTPTRIMPQKGRDRGWLDEEFKGMKRLERGDVDSGRVSGTVYHVSLPYQPAIYFELTV